jgi:hypothetical protein
MKKMPGPETQWTPVCPASHRKVGKTLSLEVMVYFITIFGGNIKT